MSGAAPLAILCGGGALPLEAAREAAAAGRAPFLIGLVGSASPEIAAFPQQCMLTDRASAYRQWFLPLAEALREEGRPGVEIVAKEGAAGAKRFVDGAGRGGTFGD